MHAKHHLSTYCVTIQDPDIRITLQHFIVGPLPSKVSDSLLVSYQLLLVSYILWQALANECQSFFSSIHFVSQFMFGKPERSHQDRFSDLAIEL